jgi:hypothetical protein
MTTYATGRAVGDVGSDAPRLIFAQQLRRCLSPRLILEIDVGERLPVVVAHDEASVGLVGGPRRREAACGRHELEP